MRRNYQNWLWIVCCWTLSVLRVAGQSAIVVDDAFADVFITPAVYRDETSRLSIEAFTKPGYENMFVPLESPFFTFGDDPSNWWLYFRIKNKTDYHKSLIININRKNFDYFEVWQNDTSGHYMAYPAVGVKARHRENLLLVNTNFVRITLPPRFESKFYCKASNRLGSVFFSLSLHTPEDFEQEKREDVLLYGIFFGVILLSIVFSLVLFIQYRNWVFIYHLLYVINILLRETYSYFPIFSGWENFERYTIPMLLAASFGTFYRHFIQLWKLMPAFDRLVVWYVRGVVVVSLIILGLSHFDEWIFSNALSQTVNTVNLFFTIATLGISIYYYKESDRAKLILIAYSPLALSFMLILLRNLNFIGNYPFISYALMWSFIFEVLVFTIGFSVLLRSLELNQVLLESTLRQESLTRQLQIQQAEQRVKDRVARDLHDDVSASFSSIRILSQVAKVQVQKIVPDLLPLLQQIQDSAQAAGESISDLIWSVKPGSDSLNDLADRIREYTSKMLDAAGIAYHFDIQREFPELILDIETKRNLFLIFKEALNNALKYSHARQISVTLAFQHDTLRLEIADDGVGFQGQEHGSGNGLKNMKNRADSMQAEFTITTAPGAGTCVVCQLPLRMAQAETLIPTPTTEKDSGILDF